MTPAPVSPTSSDMPDTSVTTTGNPVAIASRVVFESPSQSELSTYKSDA